jgi:hypothetical protein
MSHNTAGIAPHVLSVTPGSFIATGAQAITITGANLSTTCQLKMPAAMGTIVSGPVLSNITSTQADATWQVNIATIPDPTVNYTLGLSNGGLTSTGAAVSVSHGYTPATLPDSSNPEEGYFDFTSITGYSDGQTLATSFELAATAGGMIGKFKQDPGASARPKWIDDGSNRKGVGRDTGSHGYLKLDIPVAVDSNTTLALVIAYDSRHAVTTYHLTQPRVYNTGGSPGHFDGQHARPLPISSQTVLIYETHPDNSKTLEIYDDGVLTKTMTQAALAGTAEASNGRIYFYGWCEFYFYLDNSSFRVETNASQTYVLTDYIYLKRHMLPAEKTELVNWAAARY